MNYKNKQFGFSLVELSVVLAVIGLTISGALVIATKKTISDKIEETNYKMDKIENAMDAYLARHGRLPCTADGSLAKNNVDFGWEDNIPTINGVNGECDKSNFDDSGSVYYGGVPTKDLMISDEFMFDGWGRRFSYAIDARFAHNGSEFEGSGGDPACSPASQSCTNPLCDDSGAGANSACFRYQDAGTITVEDASGEERTTEAVYVLISHGKNGLGARPNFGGATLTAPADADEQQNAKNSTPFVPTFVQKDATTVFDDIVRYRTKWQIMENAGMIDDFDICISAKDVVEVANGGTGNLTDACSGVVDPAVCQGLAAQVWSWCLDM
ncbi:MAG: hypothetical protein COV35_04420 [Alphaproteobacteria bacterium CG11_big_fil_rev_8_21_14_0_20_39_49]|nr:MAG: hypothetical protein COV35_04420 [Alphaproteobacteria bacterium CG11_big_fil_rev_8_21_14_0_20_39_49]